MSLAQVAGTRYSNLALTEVKAVVIATPVLLYNIFAFNPGAAITYVQFFDALTANVSVGTTAPTFVIPLPIGGGHIAALQLAEGFRIGMIIACTATATGNGAPSGNAVVKLGYVGG